LGEPRRAVEDYDRALQIDPDIAPAYIGRGSAYALLGDHARAIENFDRALRLDPGFAPTYVGSAIAQCLLGKGELSFDDWMQALRLGALTAESLQGDLRDYGFYKGAIDGDFGPASRKALRDWTAAACPGLDG
jgi:Tfp pilus assembly protein PilF